MCISFFGVCGGGVGGGGGGGGGGGRERCPKAQQNTLLI